MAASAGAGAGGAAGRIGVRRVKKYRVGITKKGGAVFYKAIGFVTWKLGTAYLRRRFGRHARVAVLVAVASALVAGYLATRGE